MIYYTYILRCADDSLYVGCTNDLEKRLFQHNNSKRGAHYTKIRRPVILVYHEKFVTLRKARGREAELKSWRREQKLALVGTKKKA
ncbi:MAG: GIY-YIG nuclease family protein [Candidatus Paceibacterota bacterium]